MLAVWMLIVLRLVIYYRLDYGAKSSGFEGVLFDPKAILGSIALCLLRPKTSSPSPA